GVSTAKGLCYALDKPLIAVNTLEAMASGLLRRHGTPPGTGLCPMLDARRMEVFMAVYRKGPTGIECESEPQAIVLDETTLDPWLADGHGLVLFGTGAEKCRPLYENRPEIKIMDDFKQSAAHLIEPAERSYSQRRFEDVAYFEPFYLKDFISTSPRAKK
ncbi:MAG: tRNA (adenosine(37)-N6)-threonylcarbamoyltransferase complex dimerization subunit type 1 TsaB, partial [Solitalea sp.]